MRTALAVLLFAICISGGGCASPPDNSTADGVINTSLARVLAHPEDYNGKRLGLVGYYHSEFEESGLYLTKDDVTAHNYQSGLWVGSTAKDANTNRVHRVAEGFVRVVGTFSYTPKHGAGHLDLWFGMLDEITVFEVRN